jgi:hypothetical protein
MEIPIPNKLKEEIELYCKANNIIDIDTFVFRMLRQGFNIEKYGLQPNIKNVSEPKYIPLEKPTIVEETKPIPVEKPKRVTKKPIEKKKDIYDED